MAATACKAFGGSMPFMIPPEQIPHAGSRSINFFGNASLGRYGCPGPSVIQSALSTDRGGQGRFAKLKLLVTWSPKFKGPSTLDNSPGLKASVIEVCFCPTMPHWSAAVTS